MVADAVARVVEECQLQEVFHKPISHLSKGYRQRLSFAQALLHNPPVLVLDEPVSGLDPAQIRQMRDMIKRLGSKKTILLSTHFFTRNHNSIVIKSLPINVTFETSSVMVCGPWVN